VDDVRRLLDDERARTLARLARLTGDHAGVVEASRGSNADDEHDPEGATIAFERAQVEALVERARTQLDEIDAAAARLEDGTYGTCEVCGQAVAVERLRARPVARTCVSCAAAR
jgi:DnaK suppressor protein